MKLAQVRRRALALPETVEQPHFDMTSFRVLGKIFATAPSDGKHLHVFVDEEARETALALEPDYLEKLHWGKRACGLRVTLDSAKPAVVARLLEQAWRSKAPRKLLAARDAEAAGDVAPRAPGAKPDPPLRRATKKTGVRRAV